ncbi:uncharacterized protein LOC111390871 isoform X2 [Olea europaea var. sylvestris]|uniref:uncharacterized protein LOC111390871 isoform X2 n=1 Tax=Olea europaea var. sylvestris TaxID=158386 RepID=UPI000C1D4945|nr:uncharacterized protein LOC111390871 isoform X2 [Olea europaea var. sylvestris]
MLDFGDELIIESYKIPWLIWIHLLVTILFIILICFGFNIFTSDFSQNPSINMTSASPSSSNTSQSNQISSSQRTKVNENQRIKRDAGTSGQTMIEEVQECEESSLNDSIFFRLFRHPNHPCDYLGLAKQALLKCFGLDSRTEARATKNSKKKIDALHCSPYKD